MFEGLRTVIYPVADLARARAWYSALLGQEPYFDEPFYVGYSVGGFELGLDPNGTAAPAGAGGPVAYWGVPDIAAAARRLRELGADERAPIQDVGGDIRTAVVADPFGNALGIIENPHFRAENVR
jgi:predicted enzyme related to lactoylglutathione lyase